MTTSPRKRGFWDRFFYNGPSKELLAVESATSGQKFAARLLRIRAAELSESAAKIAEIAQMLRTWSTSVEPK